MVAIEQETGLKREYALLASAWPAYFTFLVSHEGQMVVDQKIRDVVVAYLNHNLTSDQKCGLMTFLLRYDDVELHDWCENVVDRLIQGDLDVEWLESTALARKLRQELAIRISLIFNFTPDENTEPIQVTEQYPLSIVFSRV